MTALPVFHRLRRRLKQVLHRGGQSREDAEDVIQDAFLRLEMYYRRGGTVGEPEAFLIRTVQRLALNARRTLRRRNRVEEAVKELPRLDVVPDPEELLAAEQSVQTIDRKLNEV